MTFAFHVSLWRHYECGGTRVKTPACLGSKGYIVKLRTRSIVSSALLLLAFASGAAHSQSTRLPFSSTFEGGNFSEWDGFRNTTGVTIESSGCQSGRCARAPLVTGTTSDNYGDFYFGDHVSSGGSKVEEVWLSFYSKFDSGITWPNRSQKLAIINLTDGVSSERRYQVYAYVRPNGEYAVDKSDIATWTFTGLYQNVGGAATSVRLGQWDKLKLYVKLNTPNQANGIVRLWVNGTLKVDYANVDIRAGTSMGLNKLILSSYATQGSGSAGVQWWDSFKLQATDPDAGTAVLPNPPTNVRAE